MLQPVSDQDSGYGELVEPPPSLWRLVEEQVPVTERAEIKRILGDAAVDLSLELHGEVEVLLDIWRDLKSTSWCPRQSSPHSLSSLLADPPVIKDMVTQEIRMLLLSVRQKARRDGLDEERVLSKYNPKVVNYVMGESRPPSRIGSSCSRYSGGRRSQTGSTGRDLRPLSSLSSGSSIEDDLEELKDKLKISDIDEVIAHLKSLLEDECRTLEKDISFLQQRLELEHQYGAESQAASPEPSLSELKEERRIIEADLHLQQSPVTSLLYQKNTSKSTKRPLDAPTISLSENQRARAASRRSLSGGLRDSELKVAPCPPSSKLKVQENRRPSSGNISGPLIPTCAALPLPPAVNAKSEQSKDIRTRTVLNQPSKSQSIAVKDMFRSSPDRHKNSETILKATYGQNPETSSAVRDPDKSFLGLDSGFVPTPPQVQRPTGTSSSSSTLRRLRTQQSISPS
ncbi:coiled-coil domain-containing protein 24 [Spea bombifrons]|uniref:coiled-coil domain-containing protein 24 n=1 Tax=Spea bombifrons TaxID=233779 RepID=UPI00234B16BA|nr:coiled-coil domain-containing protein 24 [Spea bombifrons]